MVKYIKIMALGLLLAAFAKPVQADTFQGISLDVTLDAEISISITGSTVATFGSLPLSSAAVTAAEVTVANDSVGVTVTYGLYSFNSDPYTLEDAPAFNAFALQALFNTVQPGLGDFTTANDKLRVEVANIIIASSDGGNGKFEGDESGANVLGDGATRTLWFKFLSPTSIDGGSGSRTLTVTVLANLP